MDLFRFVLKKKSFWDHKLSVSWSSGNTALKNGVIFDNFGIIIVLNQFNTYNVFNKWTLPASDVGSERHVSLPVGSRTKGSSP